MPRSMTGFGAAEGPVATGRLAFEVRSVNHRHFSTQFRLPSELQPFEADLRNRLRERIERGHVNLSARWTLDPTAAVEFTVDAARARAMLIALQALRSELGVPGEIDFGFLARQPGVIREEAGHAVKPECADLTALLDRAVDQLVAMRSEEGAALTADLRRRLAELESGAATVAGRAPARLVAERDRLRGATAQLLDGRQLDESRLAVEIALLADKLDVTEELVRLEAHCRAFRDALESDAAVGRRLSFLGQEMLRETNTIGSKANDAEIAHAVIGMKGVLEQIREQVENLE